MFLKYVAVKYLHGVKYTVRSWVSDTNTTSSAHPSWRCWRLLAVAFSGLATLSVASRTAHAQDPRDTTKVNPAPPVTPPTGMPGAPGIRLRLGTDTLPLVLPSVMSRGDRESFRQAQAQIEAARATAFQQNMRTILESVWGQVATRSFATATPIPAYPGELPPKPKPTVTPKPLPILGEYADLGLQLDGRLEFRGEQNQSAICSSEFVFDPAANCRNAFEPLVDFQFAAKSGGIVADRVHVNLDYDTQREFDASNNISIYYEGKGSEFIQRLEVGNVTFQPPASRYITAGIPSGNYGIQAVTKLGGMRFKAILAQQKGNVVSDRVFTVGDRTLQAIDRKIEDYQFESRRFFFTVDPKVFGTAYPNIDILNTTRMAALAGSLPDTLRPTKIFLYRLLIGGQPPNPNGPQFRLIGDPRSRRGQVYEYLREGIDYYADPSLLWIALVRPLALNNERLVVAYRVRIGGRDTIYTATGGTPDLTYAGPNQDQLANLIWDPNVQPGDPAFDREIRSVYRLGGADLRRPSVTLKIVTGSSEDQEKPVAGNADTYLKLFGLAQSTNSSSFDLENRIWPRPADPNFQLSLGSPGSRTIRDQFLIFPSAKPFASFGLATGGNPTNDTIYTTPPEYVRSSQRPEAVYHIRMRAQSEGSGEGGALMLGTIQIRPNSERLLVDGIPLTRGTDYSVDYDLGRVSFNRPDTLFPRPRQVTVHYEENPVFEETPTSILGATAELPFDAGQINFTAISQSQRTNFTRPPLGFEPSASLVAGVSALFNFDAEPLTQLVSKLPFGTTTVPSHVGFAAEIAASRPQSNASQQAYLESFEGEGGFPIPLTDPQWYYSSQPALGTRLPALFGPNVVDLQRSTTLAWQSNGVDADGNAVRYRIDEIDPETQLSGTGFAGAEPLLWLTLYPLGIGGHLDNTTRNFRWTVSNQPAGRRWRSIRTVLSPGGTDISRAETLEFWAQLPKAASDKNPTIVFDFGDISENTVAFGPDTLVLTSGATEGTIDSTYHGKRIQRLDHLDSERDPFSRAFNVTINDNGLPGDVVDTLVVEAGTPANPNFAERTNQPVCRGGFGFVQVLGDSRINCTVHNNRLDEEDIDADNVLNLTTPERDQEQWQRYIVNLADRSKVARQGSCSLPKQLAGQPAVARDSVCWFLIRVPFKAPDDSLGRPLLRRVRALRVTMISGSTLNDDEFSTVPLARLRLTGAPWLKVADRTLRGIAGDQQTTGTVQAGVIGTQDVKVGKIDYESPPGITDAPTSKTVVYQPGRVQINERSLRLTARDLNEFDRAETYYRFPEGEKNFMGYKELRVWARGASNGWGFDGQLQFYIKIARDENNFYMFRTPVNYGTSKAAWLPEVDVDFNRLIALRAQIQNAYLQGTERNTCRGLDSVLIANTPLPAGTPTSSRYAACEDGYVVYTIDPGTSPPNLAAVQQLAVGMLRVPVPPGVTPILPNDTLELWVDDIRLTGVVNETGFAGQVGLNITASDFADIRINASRRDGNFRQLAEQPTYLNDNTLDVSTAIRLEKLLPSSLGLTIPVTFNYTSASEDPIFVSQSDIQAEAVEGLRTPKSAATSVTFSVRRTKPSTGSFWSPLLNNLTLSSAYTHGMSRSEYQEGKAKNFVIGLDFNLSRALLPDIVAWSPTEIHLTTAYTNGHDDRSSYLKPALATDDTAQLVKGRTRTWRNGASLVFRPIKAASLRWDLSSVRDLRGYGSDSQLGLITEGDRDRVLGYDAGLERERAMQAGINISPPITAWFRPRLDFGTSYNMLRDPNTLGFTRLSDSTGALRIPRRIGNSQNLNAGLTLDIPRAVRLHTDSNSFMRGVFGGFQPLDINFNRSLLSVYDGSAVAGSIAYQFGVGGINAFRSLGDELATAAGLVTQFSVNQTINLPFGANIAGRYQRINTRNWTRRVDQGQEVVDGTQIVFPDIAFRWAGKPVGFESLISNIGVNARVLETRQTAGTQLVGNDPVDDHGRIRVRTWPLNGTLVFAGARPFSANVGYSLSKQLDVKPGLNSDGDNSDFSVDVAKPWKLPTDWNARSDLRTRVSYQRSQGRNFVFNPLALDLESRLTDNGRHAFSMSADTDVAENLSSSFVISRVESFDHNLNRRFTQTVLSAVMHLQFYAGDFK